MKTYSIPFTEVEVKAMLGAIGYITKKFEAKEYTEPGLAVLIGLTIDTLRNVEKKLKELPK